MHSSKTAGALPGFIQTIWRPGNAGAHGNVTSTPWL
jgi:hypothetical protein